MRLVAARLHRHAARRLPEPRPPDAAAAGASTQIGREAYAELALGWREEGAQIIGGCCGVGPDHIAAPRAALAGTKPGTPARRSSADDRRRRPSPRRRERWLDSGGRRPLPAAAARSRGRGGRVRADAGELPALEAPVRRERLGSGLRCLDVGCGCGIQTVQLALNGAAARARDRHRPRRDREHGRERVSQRRRGPRDAATTSTSTSGRPTSDTT